MINKENLTKYKEISFKTMRKKEIAGVLCVGTGLALVVLNLPLVEMDSDIRTGILAALVRVGIALIVCVCATVLHEGLHGLFFWRYTGRVKFGFKWWSKIGTMAYATSVGGILSKRQMIMTCIAPQILTVVSLVVIWLATLPFLVEWGLLYMAGFNLAGGCFDLYFIYLLLMEKGEIFVEDTMTDDILYRRQ